jgi:hypothetical protein
MKEKGIMSRPSDNNEKDEKEKKKTDASGKVIKHKVKTSGKETLEYWTAEKKRDAKPAQMPHVDKPDKGKE